MRYRKDLSKNGFRIFLGQNLTGTALHLNSEDRCVRNRKIARNCAYEKGKRLEKAAFGHTCCFSHQFNIKLQYRYGNRESAAG